MNALHDYLTLTEFLLARIAEDAALARHVWPERFADRMLAECEAKRQIVGEHRPSGEYDPDSCIVCQWDTDCDSPKHDHHRGAGKFPCPTLRFLALPYADRPDYREEWKP